MKKCCTCKESKELTEFYKNKSKKDGLAAQCKSCKKLSQKRYEKTEKGQKVKKKHSQSEKGKLSQKKYRVSDAGKATKRRYYQSDRGRALNRKLNAKRREMIRRQTINLTADQVLWMEWFYKMAVVYEKLTGIPHEVDHIHPISKGGLHAPWNMQILPQSENRSKGAKT